MASSGSEYVTTVRAFEKGAVLAPIERLITPVWRVLDSSQGGQPMSRIFDKQSAENEEDGAHRLQAPLRWRRRVEHKG